jgi:hypothetical protein
METYVPEEHVIQSESNDYIVEEKVEEVQPVNALVTTYDHFVKATPIPKRKHPQPSQLPETIKVLKDETTNGTIYLVGTAHFRSLLLFCLFFSSISDISSIFFVVKRVNVK